VHQLEVALLAEAHEIAGLFAAAVAPEDDVVRCRDRHTGDAQRQRSRR